MPRLTKNVVYFNRTQCSRSSSASIETAFQDVAHAGILLKSLRTHLVEIRSAQVQLFVRASQCSFLSTISTSSSLPPTATSYNLSTTGMSIWTGAINGYALGRVYSLLVQNFKIMHLCDNRFKF